MPASIRLKLARRGDLDAEARVEAIVSWVRPVAADLLIFAVSNGGLRSRAEAAGIADLTIVASGTFASDDWRGCCDHVRERVGLRRGTALRWPIKDTVAEAALLTRYAAERILNEDGR